MAAMRRVDRGFQQVDDHNYRRLAEATVGRQAESALVDPQPGWKDQLDEGDTAVSDDMLILRSRAVNDFVLRGHQFSTSADFGLGNVRPLIPLQVDPPKHAQYRKLLDPVFAPKRMDEREQDITHRFNEFVDTFIDQGECNFSEEVAELFPSSVFLGMCGLPEEDLRTFLSLRDGVLHPEKLDPAAVSDFDARIAVTKAGGQAIYDYFMPIIAARREEPVDDLVSRLMASKVDGVGLTDQELLDIMFLMLIAGLDTVSDSLTCFFAFLATHAAHRRQIVEDPSIIPSAVEELLRWESPVPGGVPRIATSDSVLPNGEKVSTGTALMISYAVANMDPTVFGTDVLEPRLDRTVNPHIAFGGGVHRCLGSHLARRELRIALREWHRRIPEYTLKPGHENLVFPVGLRHVKDLMLAWPQ
jgi:cytochrome P450